MDENNGLHVVLGASGGTASAVMCELVRHGHRARAVNRRGDADVPEGVERMADDVTNPEGARATCAGASIIYHCAQPRYTRWAEEFPPMTDAIIEGAAGAKVVFAEAGRPPKVGVISKTMVRVGGIFSPFIREFGETFYQFERPFVSDASKYERTFGPFSPTPHEDAIARTVAWFRERRGG